ncbi:MAG TPA: GNAT family protein [Gemmataceae bacterium]|nr:GNAT family protein [Gemmataceae bacterium]
MSTSYSPFLSGRRLYLREVRLEDVSQTYYRWMSDPEVTRFLESRFFPNSMESIRQFVTSKQGDRNNVFLAIVLHEQDRHIGNIKLGPIDWIHRLGEVGILIGEKDCWGKGYATEAIKLCVEYAFNRLNLHKLTAGCYANNEGSTRTFEKAGFVHEGLRKQHCFCDGTYVDVILLGHVKESP